MEVVVSTLRTFNIVSSFACVKFIICGPDTKTYIYADNVCNQEVFQISIPQFYWEAKFETLCPQLMEKECNINYLFIHSFIHVHVIYSRHHNGPWDIEQVKSVYIQLD